MYPPGSFRTSLPKPGRPATDEHAQATRRISGGNCIEGRIPAKSTLSGRQSCMSLSTDHGMRSMCLWLQKSARGQETGSIWCQSTTTHAEYIGQYNAVLHLQWLRTFLDEADLYRSPVTHIIADYQSAIALSRNPEFHKRTKHFNVKFHYQRSVLDAGEISIQYDPTKQQAADGLTKPLGPKEFACFRQLIGLKGIAQNPKQKA
ncbi:copia protein [Aspergillus awamori]|uniref:Copia protein n=1 Tax=Aspergillus awamori TaxID=105351 RepID=A0A401L2W7_ASPAW|nr:copia protein [Aspergillus awamori]